MNKFISHSLDETEKFTGEWLASLAEPKDSATIVGLYGNLGAGKTAFTQAVAKNLGVKDFVTSPTFVIMKIYHTNHTFFKRLVHIDAYRLDKGEELAMLGFEDLAGNKNNLVLIEWPENVKEILPADHIKIQCNFIDETVRGFEVQ